jgi:hypothetical protein
VLSRVGLEEREDVALTTREGRASHRGQKRKVVAIRPAKKR